MSTGKSWGHFYTDSGDADYYEQHVLIHNEFLKKVQSGNPKRLLEAGCGSGIMSVFFSKQGIRTTALDRDTQVLEIARKSADSLGGSVEFVAGDLFSLPFTADAFDAVFSQGVLEHFQDEMIRNAVLEQLRVAPISWISIPTKYYRHQDFGDERLLTESQWKEILKPVCKVETQYYYHQRVKRNFLLKKPLMLLVKATRQHAMV